MPKFIVGARLHDYGKGSPDELFGRVAADGFAAVQLAYKKCVPSVRSYAPREILQPPSPTVAVPTAAAALSPAPAITFTLSGSPSSSAISFFSVPTTSQLS